MASHVLFVAFVWLVASVAVGVDAMDRDRSAFFWGILTILTGLIGLIAYVVVVGNELDDPDRRDDGDAVVVCPSCSARHPGSPQYCSDCGEALAEEAERNTASVLRSGAAAHCSDCHAQVAIDADECPSCGSVF